MSILDLILLLNCMVAAVLAGPLPRNLDVSSAGSQPSGSTTAAPDLVPSSATGLTESPAATTALASPSSTSLSSSVTLVTQTSTTITARLNPPAFTMGVPSWFSTVEASLNHETVTKGSTRPSVSFSFSYDPSAAESAFSGSKTTGDSSIATVRSVSTTTLTLYTTVVPVEQPTGEATSVKATITPAFSHTKSSSTEVPTSSAVYPANNGTDHLPTQTCQVTGYSSETQTRVLSQTETSSVPVSSPAQKDSSTTTTVPEARSTSHGDLRTSTTADVTSSSPTDTAATPSATTSFSFFNAPPSPLSSVASSTSETAEPSSSPVVHTKTEVPKVQSTSITASSTRVESHPTPEVSSTSSQPAGITIIPITPNFVTVTVTQTGPGVTMTVTA